MARKKRWLRLDNAGKIFPSTSTKKETGVFRFSCEFSEEVQEKYLQQALEKTLLRFPHFLYILRNGLFWYYLEPCEADVKAHIEDKGVCSQLFFRNERHLLFDVSYFRSRVNLEVYHAVTDGTGAMQFLKYLVCCYLSLVHPESAGAALEDEISPAPVSSQEEDSFKRYYQPLKSGSANKKMIFAHRIKGVCSEQYIATEGIMSCAEVLSIAKSKDVSLTIFLCSLLVLSIHREMSLDEEKKPVVLTVPVNLRQYFHSETTRNFFGNIRVSYKFNNGSEDPEDVIATLKDSFKRELDPDNLKSKMNGYMAVEKNFFAKLAPLSLKNITLKIARYISDMGESMVVSNVGKITLPDKAAPFVKGFSIFASTNRVQVCICSYGDTLSVCFTSRYEDTDIQRNFFRMLTDMGIKVQIRSNMQD